jgi:hypothetical protein
VIRVVCSHLPNTNSSFPTARANERSLLSQIDKWIRTVSKGHVRRYFCFIYIYIYIFSFHVYFVNILSFRRRSALTYNCNLPSSIPRSCKIDNYWQHSNSSTNWQLTAIKIPKRSFPHMYWTDRISPTNIRPTKKCLLFSYPNPKDDGLPRLSQRISFSLSCFAEQLHFSCHARNESSEGFWGEAVPSAAACLHV